MSRLFAFRKIQGCGNDFIVCHRSSLPVSFLSSPSDIAALCDRHVGVGSDGLMVVGALSSSLIEVLMYNPDGTEMGMCGNGIRCVVRFLFLEGSIPAEQSGLVFSVFGRRIECYSIDQGQTVRVNMGQPSFAPEQIPISSNVPFEGLSLKLESENIEGWALSMGNPHFVTFVEELDVDFAQSRGAEIELHSLFPKRTNVEFVNIIDENNIDLLVWERGAGFTLACGTGACASVVAGIRKGVLASPCRVDLPGGSLEVEWDSVSHNANVYLTGPAVEVFSGVLSE